MKVSRQTSVLLTVETSVDELQSIEDLFNVIRNTLKELSKLDKTVPQSKLIDKIDREIVVLKDIIDPLLG